MDVSLALAVENESHPNHSQNLNHRRVRVQAHRVVTYGTYNDALVKHNILVKAKNFLVFQGDVGAVASQSPKELARLIDQISGSLELAPE